MMCKGKVILLLVMLVMGLGGAPEVRGQIRPGGPPGQGPPRQELERRVMQGFARLVQEQLGLSQDELASLQETMQSFREDRRALAMDQQALRYELRNPTLEEISEDEARRLLAEMVRIQQQELTLYEREQTELLTVLSPRQLVRFYHIRDEWGRRIQQLRQGRGPGGPGGFDGGLSQRPGSRGPGGGTEDFGASGAWLGGWVPFR